jgi:hypothetical protein
MYCKCIISKHIEVKLIYNTLVVHESQPIAEIEWQVVPHTRLVLFMTVILLIGGNVEDIH